jgi:energy-coupling factor transporter ATP-binding protein EcfA2
MESIPRDVVSQLTSNGHEPTNGSSNLQAEDDPFERALDWHFLVINPADAPTLRRFGSFGLNVAHYSEPGIEKWADGEQVIVIAPIEGPERDEAIKAANHLRNFASRLVLYDMPSLGRVHTPDLLSVERDWTTAGIGGLAVIFGDNPPWEKPEYVPRPSASAHTNGNGKAGGNGRYGGLLIAPSEIDYESLTAEQLNIQDASAIKIKPIKWLWKYRLAEGEMALVAGEGGLGKSQVILAIAAAVSNGSPWPDGEGIAPKGQVVIVTAEDSPETTIVPRLMALGANLDAIKVITAPKIMVNTNDKEKEPYIELQSLQHLRYWRRVCSLHPNLKLLIMDPFASYLGPGVSEQKNDQMRSVIEPFLGVIRPRGICFLANTHLGKSLEGKSLLHRILGSVAVVNIPRNVHAVFRHPDDPQLRVFAQCKCNNAPDDLPGLQFRIEVQSVESDEGDIETSMSGFLDQFIDPHTLKRIMAVDRGRPGPKPVKLEDVALWLKGKLEHGRPVPQRDLINDAREAGHLPPERDGSKTALYNAADRFSEFVPGWQVFKDKHAKPQTFQLVQAADTGPSQAGVPF